jgi:RNA polymerase sigma-70 factor (sigma-E family)
MGTNVTAGSNPGDGRPVYQEVTASFETFYHGTAPRLLRYAYGLTGDMSEAQDFTQEAYARAWQRWKKLQGYDNPESWLRLVVNRLATDRWRWLGVRRLAAQPRPGEVQPPDVELVNLVAELKQLPVQQRRALVLHYLLDRPVADIAQECGVSVNTVKSWLLRGRENLAAQMTEQPPLPPTQRIIQRGRQRTVSKVVIAFLVTSTAALAGFFAFPTQTPPTSPPVTFVPWPANPAPVLRYDSPVRIGMVAVDQRRAYALWHEESGEINMGAIELATGQPAWAAPVSLGEFGDTMGIARVTESVVLAIGEHDDGTDPDYVAHILDTATGKLLWQKGFDFNSASLELAGDTLTVSREGQTEGFSLRTGEPKWSIPRGTTMSTIWGERLVQVAPSGEVSVFEAATGELVWSRPGLLPELEQSSWPQVIGDDLYLQSAKRVHRLPMTGDTPAEVLRTGDVQSTFPCYAGKACVLSKQHGLSVFAQGKELWHRPATAEGRDFAGLANVGAVQIGDPWQGDTVLYDADGNDITPPGLGNRAVMWIDDNNLLLVNTDQEPIEVSGYSLTARVEVALGRIAGGICKTTTTTLICPSAEGIALYPFTTE